MHFVTVFTMTLLPYQNIQANGNAGSDDQMPRPVTGVKERRPNSMHIVICYGSRKPAICSSPICLQHLIIQIRCNVHHSSVFNSFSSSCITCFLQTSDSNTRWSNSTRQPTPTTTPSQPSPWPGSSATRTPTPGTLHPQTRSHAPLIRSRNASRLSDYTSNAVVCRPL